MKIMVERLKTKVFLATAGAMMATSGHARPEAGAGNGISGGTSGGEVKDIGGLADKVSSSFGSLIKLGMSGAFLVGVFFAIMGIMRLKAAADSQGQQVKYSEGLWRLGVAAALCGIPAVITILGGTAGISAGGGENLLNTLSEYQ